jgi:hypothetical protein
MWLINVHTLKLESIVNPETYRYVILSHTWEKEEVSYQEFVHEFEAARYKKGYDKILKTCELAEKKVYPTPGLIRVALKMIHPEDTTESCCFWLHILKSQIGISFRGSTSGSRGGSTKAQPL